MSVLPTAHDFIDIFEKLYALLGPSAFGAVDATLLHSGPHNEILIELFGRNVDNLDRGTQKYGNFARSSRLAKRIHAVRLEDARLGGALDALAVYSFFKEAYTLDRKAGEQEADKVWRYLSRKFVASLSGKVYTCVCGADRSRVFFEEELPELVRNDKIDTINNVPWIKIRDAYLRDPEEAYKMICRSEMRLAWDRAKNEATKESVEDFYYARAYYRIGRRKELEDQGKPILAAFRPRTRKEHRAALSALKVQLMPFSPK